MPRTTVPRNLTPTSDLLGHQVHTWHKDIHLQKNTHTHIIKYINLKELLKRSIEGLDKLLIKVSFSEKSFQANRLHRLKL